MNLAQQWLPYFYPISIVMYLIVLSLFLLILFKSRKWPMLILIVAFVVLFISAHTGLSLRYLGLLENRFPPVDRKEIVDQWIERNGHSIDAIVVLGAGGVHYEGYPMSSQLAMPGVVRVVEAIRWWRLYPQTKILFSGGPALRGSTEAEMMKELAMELGVPESSIDMDPISKSSDEQIEVISKRMGKNGFLLITSAYKMDRIARGFMYQGSRFLPIPTDYVNKQPDLAGGGIADHPWAENLGHSELMVKEFLGSLWRKYFHHEK